ncbi:MAG TPA: RsmB/NOP family class I SAM-dependent RNA methyltransferase, partial [Waddliaceae bacterium]
PTTVRVNTLKITRDEMLVKWQKEYDVSPCKLAPHGIIFHKKIALFALPEFKEGLFEVQDEGSQLAAELVRVEKGQQVMDYCAGSGGKALAFAPRMQHSGQIYLHDIRASILQECRRRLRRAGIQNAQIAINEDAKLKKLKKRMHWVLVDIPCSGTGTMRRNVDSKWKFTSDVLNRLLGQQRLIFEKALSYLCPGGRIVYVTCSILSSENQEQVHYFMKTYNLEMEGLPFQSLPSEEGMDGFFGVTLISK